MRFQIGRFQSIKDYILSHDSRWLPNAANNSFFKSFTHNTGSIRDLYFWSFDPQKSAGILPNATLHKKKQQFCPALIEL